ncbi:MAG: transcription elongation factor GreA [Patescibacteria group bacterium]
MTNGQSYITKDGLLKLKQEYKELREARREIANRIQEAKELGDLSENAEYQEAKNAQAFNEGRILDIENVLKNAEVIEENDNHSQIIQVGSTITVESGGKKQTYKIVGSNEADPASGVISNESPLGQAFIGRKVSDMVEVQVPKGAVRYKIVSVE